jgi:pyruvate dehydrogenase E2 component (dihydrolipoamide acetyltransferase)
MDVLMPQLGETVAEGKISAWFRAVGDPVKAGDNLFEVETDKTAMEVPTLVSGVVAEIRVSAGDNGQSGEIGRPHTGNKDFPASHFQGTGGKPGARQRAI